MVRLGPKLTLSTCAAQQIQITSTSRFWSTKILLSIGPFDLVFFGKKMGLGPRTWQKGFARFTSLFGRRFKHHIYGFDKVSCIIWLYFIYISTRFRKFETNSAALSNKKIAILHDVVSEILLSSWFISPFSTIVTLPKTKSSPLKKGAWENNYLPFRGYVSFLVVYYMDVSKNSGIPKSSILIGGFHYKPSILGVPLFLETPI